MRATAVPIAANAAWRTAAAAAGEQCQHHTEPRGRAKPHRCTRTLAGGWQLYQDSHDGLMYCRTHFDQRQKREAR